MAGHHAPLLQLQLARFLGKSARSTAPTAAEITASVALDTITVADAFTTAHLDDAAHATADHEGSVGKAITTARVATFGMGVTLALEMLETRFVLSVDDAGQPPCDEACMNMLAF